MYREFSYGVRAYDFGDYISLFLTPYTTKSRLALDKGIVYEDGNIDPTPWEELYVKVTSGSVSADCYISEVDGKKYKNVVNRELLTTLGNILEGMRSGCNKSREDKGDELFDTGFNPMKVIKYNFENRGYVKLDLKILRELKYENHASGVTLELEDDGHFTEQLWEAVKPKHKFKLDLSEFIEVKDDSDWDIDFGEDKIFTLAEIIERNPDKDYVWLKGRKYHVVKPDQVESICKMIWQHKKKVAFDTETTGLNVNITSRYGIGDRLVGMVFSIKSGEAYYFPVAHKHIENICTPGDEKYIIEKYFKPILENKPLICHNGAYDWAVMYNYGICCNIVDDTYILFKLTLWNDHRHLALGLKPLVKTFLGRDSFELKDFVVGKFGENNVKFWDLDEESTKYYACPDTDSLLDLYEYAMKERLLEKYNAKKIYEIEVLFSIVIAYQQYYGHCVDVNRIDSLRKDIAKDIAESYKEMVKIAGHDFNPGSSKQLGKVLFEELGMPVIGYTDAGNPSVDKDTRKRYLNMTDADGNLKYPIIKYLSTWKDASTLQSNFTNNIDKFATPEGLMFSSVSQFLETGRVSTSDPNYQGYSDTVKKYVGPRTGYYAMDADYSSVEARIMCSWAGCKAMVEKLKDPDTDYHRQKASDMFNVAYELVTDKLRKMSKGVNFGILYGLGDPNLGVNLYGFKSPENTRKAKRQKKLYYKGMEELGVFVETSRAQGGTNGYSETYFLRRRYYDSKTTSRDRIERQSCNARIQGTAADLYKLAMCRLFLQIKKRGWLGKVLISAFVHDECFLEVHKSIDPCVMLKVLRECMMIEIEGWCPLFIGAGYGRTWYEAKHTEIPVQVQESLVNNYGETGLDWWDGDTDRLCEFIVDSIEDYKRDRVINYMKNEDNYNKVLKPTENELAHEVLSDINKGIHIEEATVSECNPSTDMLENLKEFCRVFNILDLFNRANILKPEESHQDTNNDEEDEEEEEVNEIDTKELLLARVNMLGVHSTKDAKGRKVYFKYDDKNPVLMGLLHKVIENNPGDMEVLAIKEDGNIYTTGMKTSIKAYPKMVQLYVSSKNLSKSANGGS